MQLLRQRDEASRKKPPTAPLLAEGEKRSPGCPTPIRVFGWLLNEVQPAQLAEFLRTVGGNSSAASSGSGCTVLPVCSSSSNAKYVAETTTRALDLFSPLKELVVRILLRSFF